MTNTIVGWGLIATVGIAVLGGITDANDTFYMIDGLAMMVFGVWGGIRLIQSDAK